ncbi:MAG: hypothetical protein V4697_03295, partial [Patescibacteria group bacterium]
MSDKNIEGKEISEAVNLVLKIRGEGRMHEEEMSLMLEVIFSDDFDREFLNIIKFIFRHRPQDQWWIA